MMGGQHPGGRRQRAQTPHIVHAFACLDTLYMCRYGVGGGSGEFSKPADACSGLCGMGNGDRGYTEPRERCTFGAQ
jgi:hypothetical protein